MQNLKNLLDFYDFLTQSFIVLLILVWKMIFKKIAFSVFPKKRLFHMEKIDTLIFHSFS